MEEVARAATPPFHGGSGTRCYTTLAGFMQINCFVSIINRPNLGRFVLGLIIFLL